MSFSLSEYTKIDVGWGFKGAALRQEGNGGERSTRGRGRGKGRGMGGMGKGGEKGKLGDSALVVGGIDASASSA